MAPVFTVRMNRSTVRRIIVSSFAAAKRKAREMNKTPGRSAAARERHEECTAPAALAEGMNCVQCNAPAWHLECGVEFCRDHDQDTWGGN